MATLAFEIVKRTAVLTHGADDPDPEEWRAYVTQLCAQPLRGILVLTDGPSPGARQRQEMHDRFEGTSYEPPVTAVVTGALMARGAITAISWFNYKISAFSPRKLDAALDFVQTPQDERSDVLRAAYRCRASMASITFEPDEDSAIRRELERSFQAFVARHASRVG